MRSCTSRRQQEKRLERGIESQRAQRGVLSGGLRSLFCPNCGRETSDLIEGLCRECFADRIEIEKIVRSPRIMLKYCRICDSFFKGKERVRSVERAVEDFVAQTIMKRLQCEDLSIHVEIAEMLRKSISVVMHVSIVVNGVEIEDEFPLEIALHRAVCDVCSRFVGGYYEAIIQIRADGRDPTEEEMRIAREIALSSLRENDFISEKRVRHGIDLYVSSTACARRISREIVRYMGGSVSESPKLYGMVDGREAYRVSFSVRLPSS